MVAAPGVVNCRHHPAVGSRAKRTIDMKQVAYVWGLAGLLACLTAQAADADLEARLAKRLKTVLPDDKITSVRPGPVKGVFEVLLGATVLYMSEDGRYVFRGDIFDLDSKSNVTDARRQEARVAAFAAIDPATTIEFAPAKGKASKTLYVFTDIDCGYCRKFHKQMAQLNNAGIAVRYLAFPRTGLDSESAHKAETVWCSENRKEALTSAKSGKMPPAKQCNNPVAEQFHLGQSMGVHGTPAVFTEEGEELGGFIPAEDLIQMLSAGG